jgi:hypothetical protein
MASAAAVLLVHQTVSELRNSNVDKKKKKKFVNVLKHLKFFCQCFKTFEKKKNSNVVQHLKKKGKILMLYNIKKNSNVIQHLVI